MEREFSSTSERIAYHMNKDGMIGRCYNPWPKSKWDTWTTMDRSFNGIHRSIVDAHKQIGTGYI